MTCISGDKMEAKSVNEHCFSLTDRKRKKEQSWLQCSWILLIFTASITVVADLGNSSLEDSGKYKFIP